MIRFQKRHVFVSLVFALALGLSALSTPASGDVTSERLDGLFAELAEDGRTDWMQIEREILRIWENSGSDAMNLLLRRSKTALEAGDFDAALDHLNALTDHAPEFAEGWNARATTFYLMDEYALSIADVERVLALNPRHFGALAGLAIMLERLGETTYAIRALRAVRDLNPNRPDIADALERLERAVGAADL